jgi:hypothetical protein
MMGTEVNVMSAQKSNQLNGKQGGVSLVICLLLFSLYFLNVVLGKVNIAYGLNLPHLESVAEFLLLFAASIVLIVAALKREAMEKEIEKSDNTEVQNEA